MSWLLDYSRHVGLPPFNEALQAYKVVSYTVAIRDGFPLRLQRNWVVLQMSVDDDWRIYLPIYVDAETGESDRKVFAIPMFVVQKRADIVWFYAKDVARE